MTHSVLLKLKITLKNLKYGKACGYDEILSTSDYMLPIYHVIFNIILKTGIIPENWSIAIINPVYKNKGDKRSAENYRGISLVSCLCKVFTSLLNSRIECFLNRIGALDYVQAGFRKEHSTLDHIFALHVIVDYYLQKHKKLYCCFVDFEKAFDNVDRLYLWQKIINIGVTGNILKVVFNMYSSVKSVIRANNALSNFFP